MSERLVLTGLRVVRHTGGMGTLVWMVLDGIFAWMIDRDLRGQVRAIWRDRGQGKRRVTLPQEAHEDR